MGVSDVLGEVAKECCCSSLRNKDQETRGEALNKVGHVHSTNLYALGESRSARIVHLKELLHAWRSCELH